MPKLPRPPRAAAEREPGDTGAGDATAGDGESVLLRRRVEFAPVLSAPGRSGASLRVDGDPFHEREVDHEAAITAGVALRRMPATFDGHEQVVLASEPHATLDVSGVCG